MNNSFICAICVHGHLPNQWLDWFSGLQVVNRADGDAELSGEVCDQAALFGVLIRLRDLGMSIVSLHCVSCGEWL